MLVCVFVYHLATCTQSVPSFLALQKPVYIIILILDIDLTVVQAFFTHCSMAGYVAFTRVCTTWSSKAVPVSFLITRLVHVPQCSFDPLKMTCLLVKYMITTHWAICYFGMRDAMYNHTDKTSLGYGCM